MYSTIRNLIGISLNRSRYSAFCNTTNNSLNIRLLPSDIKQTKTYFIVDYTKDIGHSVHPNLCVSSSWLSDSGISWERTFDEVEKKKIKVRDYKKRSNFTVSEWQCFGGARLSLMRCVFLQFFHFPFFLLCWDLSARVLQPLIVE